VFKLPLLNYNFHVVMFRTVYLFQLNTTTSVLLMVVLFWKMQMRRCETTLLHGSDQIEGFGSDLSALALMYRGQT